MIQAVSTNYLMYRFRVPKREYLQLREKGNNNVGIKNLRIIRNECKSMKENITNTSVKKKVRLTSCIRETADMCFVLGKT